MIAANTIPPRFSVYLDLVRFLAAGAVFLDHFTSYPFSDNTNGPREGLAQIGNYGAAAVVVFFVLSGFVIAHVAETREKTGHAFAISRLSRLYSVVLPALLLTLVFDTAGQWLHPEFYAIKKVFWNPPSIQGYWSSLLFINEFSAFQFKEVVPGSNAPFWSLSFEATYYLVIGLILFAPRWIAAFAAFAIFAMAGRTIIAMAPLWGLGFLLYRFRLSALPRIPAPLIVLGISGLLLLALPFLLTPLHWTNFGVKFPWGRGPFNRDLLLDYAVAVVFAVHLLAAERLFGGNRAFGRGEGFIRYLGLATFPMYAIHYPVLCFFAAISPWDRESPLSMAFITLSVTLVGCAMVPVCEWLKRDLRTRLARTRPPQVASGAASA